MIPVVARRAALLLCVPALLAAQLTPDRVQSGNGARALGMGNAFTAIADDATAIGWNPAGLATLRKAEFAYAGAMRWTQVDPRISEQFYSYSAVQSKSSASPANFAGFAIPFGAGPIRFGVGAAYRTLHDWTRSLELRSYYESGDQQAAIYELNERTGGVTAISPSVAVSLFNRVSLGATANIVSGATETYESTERLGAQTNPGTSTSIGKVDGYSGTALELGALVRVTSRISFGARLGLPYDRTSTARVGTASRTSRLEIPQTLAIGMAVLVTPGVRVALDVRQQPWTEGRLLSAVGDTVLSGQVGAFDVTSVHLGAERVEEFNGRRVATRVGLYTRPLAQADADGNQIHLYGASLGRGWRFGRLGLDLTANYQRSGEYIARRSTTGQAAMVDQEVQVVAGMTVFAR